MHTVFSPAVNSRLVPCHPVLPSPGVVRRGHGIRGWTPGPFKKMWGKTASCRAPQDFTAPIIGIRGVHVNTWRKMICLKLRFLCHSFHFYKTMPHHFLENAPAIP